MNGGCGTVRRKWIAGSFGLFSESRQDGSSHKGGFPLCEEGEFGLPFSIPLARGKRAMRSAAAACY